MCQHKFQNIRIVVPTCTVVVVDNLWARGSDLNRRPVAYEATKLPTAPPRAKCHLLNCE